MYTLEDFGINVNSSSCHEKIDILENIGIENQKISLSELWSNLIDLKKDLKSFDSSYKKRICELSDNEIFKLKFNLIQEKYNDRVILKKNNKNISRFYYKNNDGFKIGILSLAPKKSSKVDICMKAGTCKDFCLGYNISKNGQKISFKNDNGIFYKLIKTIAFLYNPNIFLEKLCLDILNFIKLKNPVLRLNGYSDLLWENIEINITEELKKEIDEFGKLTIYDEELITKYSLDEMLKLKPPVNKEVKIGNRYKIFEIFPGVIFYDYTKYNKRDNASEYSNYYLTYSYDTHIAKNGINLNMKSLCLITQKNLKNKLLNDKNLSMYNFIDGDISDFRLIDKLNSKSEKIILLEVTSPSNNNTKKSAIKDSPYILKDGENLKKIIEINNDKFI